MVDDPDVSAHRPRLTAAWPLPDRVHPALRRTLAGHAHTVHAVAWSPDGRRLATVGWDRKLRGLGRDQRRVLGDDACRGGIVFLRLVARRRPHCARRNTWPVRVPLLGTLKRERASAVVAARPPNSEPCQATKRDGGPGPTGLSRLRWRSPRGEASTGSS